MVSTVPLCHYPCSDALLPLKDVFREGQGTCDIEEEDCPEASIGHIEPLSVRVKSHFRRILDLSTFSGVIGELWRVQRQRLDLDQVAIGHVDVVDDELRVELGDDESPVGDRVELHVSRTAPVSGARKPFRSVKTGLKISKDL